jgi:ubiquinone/menaquinone biosynthesis C-methylase UbiE
VPYRNFIPGLRFRILTPLYDIFLRVGIRETRLKSYLITQLNPKDNEKILDFGCGTGTLMLMVKKARPGSVVHGIDIDPRMLEAANKKAHQAGVEVHLIKYDGITLPFADETFDKVVTSLVLHHLSTQEKFWIFREIYRVLKRSGELHIMDFGIQRTMYTRLLTSITKRLEPIGDNILGKIPEYLIISGFKDVEDLHSENTLFGSVSFYRSKKL